MLQGSLSGIGEAVLDPQITVVTPVFRAERFIAAAVRSVLAQTYPNWRMVVISDDERDYQALLAAEGLADPRLSFLSTGTVGAGASRARNLALDRIETPYLAILDADDRFKPTKLELAVAALADYPIVSSALELMNDSYAFLRTVGEGPDRALSPAEHKFVSLSMDSMIAWDRRKCDARYDLTLTNMTDLELLMQLYRTAERSYHLGTPLHDYVKVSSSMSNGPGFSEKMIRSKSELLARLEAGRYPMADPAGPAGIARFLEISLKAEESYPAALAAKPGLLFEDHIGVD
jgi:glycosyltransferase involved in cell wall biosynthesis